MKTRKFHIALPLLCLLGVLASCQETSSTTPLSSTTSDQTTSTGDSTLHSTTTSSSVTSDSYPDSFQPSYSTGGGEDITDNPSKWTPSDFRARVAYLVENPEALAKATLESRRYVKPTTAGYGTNEYEKTDYTYYLGDILVGEAENRTATGTMDYSVDPDSGYDYDIQAYPEDDYLIYAEKAPKGAGQISYMDAYKINRYQNLYTLYNTTLHLAVAEDAVKAIDGTYWSEDYTVEDPIVTLTEGVATLRIEADRPGAYGYGANHEWVEISMEEESGKLLSAESGFYVYGEGLTADNPEYYTSIRSNTISNFSYGGRSSFEGDFIREENVDKVYSAPQKKVDYSAWADGELTDAQANLVLKNIQAYAKGATRSTIEFSYPDFINVYKGYYGMDAETGEYIVGGTLSGTMERKLYEGDFVQTLGTLSYQDDEGLSIQDAAYRQETTADDSGITILADFGTLSSVLPNHKHVLPADTIEDVDPYIGVNPVYDEEAAHPALMAGTFGMNCSGASDENGSVTYTNSGNVTKQGNALTGTLIIDEKFVWTPYRKFFVKFKIVDNFLCEYSFTCETYRYEQDTTILELEEVSYDYKNYKEEVSSYVGEKLDAAEYSEPTVTYGGYTEIITDDKEKLYL